MNNALPDSARLLLEALELETKLAARLDAARDDPDAPEPSARVLAMRAARRMTDEACTAFAAEESR